MKFIFTKNLDYQLDAINSIVNLFDTGKNIIQNEEIFHLKNAHQIIPNELELDYIKIKNNLKSIQIQNNINIDEWKEPGFEGFYVTPDFSVEMETGTGKTYVYLRTILELNQKYNLKKFIILVPSVAIREGVLKTLEQTKDHFRTLYNTGFDYFAYDSKKLNKIRDFAQSNDIQIMIMTVQSFAGSERLVMRQTPDRFHGEKPIDLIAATRPIVIMDEPQNMESDLAKEAIKDLNSLCRLRYSATHKDIYNLVYKLTPVDAYRKGLVKKISVYGVKENETGDFIFNVKNIKTEKGKNPKAIVSIEVKDASGQYAYKEVTLSAGDDVYRKSKNNEKYKGLIVQDIDANHNRVELSDGNFYIVNQVPENKELIFRTQIRETIKSHFDKQSEIGNRIKVLSLFFIDKVDNYIHDNSLIRNIFIEEFNKLKKNYDLFKDVDVSTVHKGYFASKKTKGVIEYKDSTSGSSKEDKEAYDLIMKNKEQLLSFLEPVSFIFSHSALKEGWDNPNIFQICTLRETNSIMKKRQEIGRGLRLPVDIDGNRVYDQNIAKLTVIANSSYEEYAGGLQQEFVEAGYKGLVGLENKREIPLTVKTTKYLHSEDFQELWKRIGQKTTYTLDVLTDELTKKSVDKINELDIKAITVTVEKGEIYFDKNETLNSTRDKDSAGYRENKEIHIPNIVDRIARETDLTRKTILDILSKVDNLDLVFQNPEEYIRSVILIIKTQLHNLLVNNGLKYTKTGEVYEMDLFTEFSALSSRSIATEKCVFDHVVFDSKGESQFAEGLENNSKVKVYTKLPREFYIDTPIGKYNPDWAIVWKSDDYNKGEKFFFVRETKFEYDDIERDTSWEEWQKIKCARKHFAELGVDYEVAQEKDLSDLIR
ncbi:DEAD/DEAH box helicase family protein [Arenimonas sp.]|nr:DEAD/DEAH box helicase family protein [Candidatus Parcubacteria bacterium]